jgi:long-chain acyl-CoA synthetase
MPLETTVESALPTDQRRSVGRTAAWLAKQVEIGLATVDLSLPQYRVLGLLDESTAVSSDLANRLDVRPPTITAVVDGLVTRGLVERRSVAGDRRRVSHALTPEGRRLLVAGDKAVFDRLSETVEALHADGDRALAFDGLEAWRRALLAAHLARKAANG